MEGQVFVREFPAPPLNREAVFRYARMPVPTPETEALLTDVLRETEGRLAYRVCWAEFPLREMEDGLDLGFARTASAGLRQYLQGCDRVVVFAATVGMEPDRLMARYARSSPARALLLQALATERIESLCDAFQDSLASQAEKQEMGISPRFSPGYGDLPLEFQQDIFRILDCSRKIGLTLNESLLMSPTKSVTALIGLGRCPGHSGGSGCCACGKTDCAFRRSQ